MNIVFDIGGTNMRIASAEGDTLREIQKIPTPKHPDEGISSFAQVARQLVPGSIGAIGGGIAADYIRGGVLSGATNLPEWNGINLVQACTDALHAPVSIVNDTVAAGLGEKNKGAGRGYDSVAYITVSTGVGGTCIREHIEESPILRELQAALGDLESQISGKAIQKKFGIHPKDLQSLDERNKLADIFAGALEIISTAWKPDVFVIGGSMIVGVNPIPLDRVRERFAHVPVRMAELGDNCGLVGGAILAQK